MSTEAARRAEGVSPFEQLHLARQILLAESRALGALAARLGAEFCRAVECLSQARACVIVCGMGKAGLIGRKIAATLASTGTPSHWLHPAEAVHGDLGRVRSGDVMLVLSQSGETEEIVRLLPALKRLDVPIVAITSRADSTLGRAGSVVLELGPLQEACPLGLAPSTSTTAMLALGDALALVLSRVRGFSREDFARFHPAGTLGKRLSKVEDHMRSLDRCRVADQELSVRQVLVGARLPGRRTGATMLVDRQGRLTGIFTDSDLARLFEQRRDDALDRPVREVMTADPLRIRLGAPMLQAVDLLVDKKISELPVVDDEDKPAGLIDITDVVGLLPREAEQPPADSTAGNQPACRVFPEPRTGPAA